MRARADAVAAADAFTAVGCNRRVNVHLARFGAGIAADALALIKMHAVEGDLIEETVDGAKGADIFAEGPVNDEACDEDQTENYKLYVKQHAELACDLFIQSGEPDSCNGA